MASVIAHRGFRSDFPENTLPALEAALNLPGLAGAEFDVELSLDGRPMVLHQETVVPSQDFSKVIPATRDFVSRDWVGKHHSGEISRLDAGSWFSARFSGTVVPRLCEALQLDWKTCTAYVELKDPTYWSTRDASRPSRIVEAVLPDLLAFKGSANIISFNPEILAEVRRRMPEIPTTFALWTEWQSRQAEAIDTARRIGARTITLADSMVLETPSWVASAHAKEIQIHVYPLSPARGEPEYDNWTAESQVEKWERLVEIGVDALVSDFPREALAFLA